MINAKQVYLVSGSRHTVPPNKKSPGVPRIIETLSVEDSADFYYKVISKFDDGLKEQEYDGHKFLHIKPTFWNRVFEQVLPYIPFRFRKRIFGYVLPDRIVYYEGIKRLIKKEKPDVVITFMHFQLFKKLHKAYPQAKHIYFFRSTDLKLRLGEENIDYLLRNASGFLANTKSPIAELQSFSPDLTLPTETIYNAVNLKKFSDKISENLSKEYRKKFNLTKEDFIIGYAGRFSEEKSILELLEAVAYLKNKGLSVHVFIAGSIRNESTPNMSYYQQLVEYVDRHISDQIHFLGWLPNEKLYKFYNAIDVGVLLSKYSEGNSMFLLETLSMGKPVIATNIGGNAEVVADGYNGFLIAVENVRDNLINKLEQILNNRSLLKCMETNALNYIKQNHTNDVMVSKFKTFMLNFKA